MSGRANKRTEVPMTTDTLVQIGSNTKARGRRRVLGLGFIRQRFQARLDPGWNGVKPRRYSCGGVMKSGPLMLPDFQQLVYGYSGGRGERMQRETVVMGQGKNHARQGFETFCLVDFLHQVGHTVRIID